MQHKIPIRNNRNIGRKKSLLLILGLFSIPACTVTGSDSIPKSFQQASWAANGYWGPLRSSEPIIIGLFGSKSACEAGLEEWLSSQVVGQEVSGECLPIDRD